MFKRVILYLPTIIIIGCADDMDDQIMQKDLNDGELVESNDSLLVTTQVKDEVGEAIPPKTPHSAALGLKFVQAAKTKVLPKSETFLSTEFQVDSIKPKNTLKNESHICPVGTGILNASNSPVTISRTLLLKFGSTVPSEV